MSATQAAITDTTTATTTTAAGGAGHRKTAWQPLHPDVRPRLDPQYVKLHDEELQYFFPDHERQWDPAIRQGSPNTPLGLGPVAVGAVETFDLGLFQIRAFTPSTQGPSDSPRPGAGWPLFVWFHGGGFALGDLGSDLDIITRICQESQCVVASIGYRLAPEHKYPASIEDSVAALRWLLSPEDGVAKLGLDRTRFALGGASAGALLAVSAALHCAQDADPDVRPSLQVLIVPVVDNTAQPNGERWSVNGPTAPGLTPTRMLWYRNMWLNSPADALNWDASVDRAPPELIARLPPSFVAIADQDLLAPEGEQFADLMAAAGVPVEKKIYKGCTHALLAYSGWTSRGSCFMTACIVSETRFIPEPRPNT
ncbi:hypothetical protein RB593_006981 [Gaeumannomyces tritici]